MCEMNEIKEGHVIPANKKKGKQIHFSLNILHKKTQLKIFFIRVS